MIKFLSTTTTILSLEERTSNHLCFFFCSVSAVNLCLVVFLFRILIWDSLQSGCFYVLLIFVFLLYPCEATLCHSWSWALRCSCQKTFCLHPQLRWCSSAQIVTLNPTAHYMTDPLTCIRPYEKCGVHEALRWAIAKWWNSTMCLSLYRNYSRKEAYRSCAWSS